MRHLAFGFWIKSFQYFLWSSLIVSEVTIATVVQPLSLITDHLPHLSSSQLSRSCSNTIRYWSIFPVKQWWNCSQLLKHFYKWNQQNVPVTAIIWPPKQYWVLSVNIVIKACVHVAVLIWLVTQWSPVTVVCWLEPDNDQVVIDRSRVISVCRLYRPPTGQPLSNLFVSTARALIGPIIKTVSQLNNVRITRLTRTITTQKIFSSDCSKAHFIWSSLQENTSAVNEWNFYTTWNWNEFLKDAKKVCLKSFYFLFNVWQTAWLCHAYIDTTIMSSKYIH